MHWTKNERLAAIVAERGLSLKGFCRSLRAIVEELYVEQDDELSREDSINDTFGEWFGNCHVVPAAYRIRRENREGKTHISEYDITIEVYEVEGTAELTEHKWYVYGRIADGDGPHCELHILDKYDHEIVVECDDLMRFGFIDLYKPEDKKQLFKEVRRRATVQHHAPVIVDDARLSEREHDIRILKRRLMKNNYSNIEASLQEVIYGLGLGRKHKDIAQRTGLHPAVIRATARLLTTSKVNPREIVSDTHARWKAAYDAVRELGITL